MLDCAAFDNISESLDTNALSVMLDDMDDSYHNKSEQLLPLSFEYPMTDITCAYSPISTPLSSILGMLR